VPRLPRIALTSGEPAGIGPDLCLQLARTERRCELVCLGDRELLRSRARALGIRDLELRDYDPLRTRSAPPRTLSVLHTPLEVEATPGQLDVRNAHAVLAMLDRAIDGCRSGEFDALVTAPVQKSVLLDAGIAFSGHTEHLAARCAAPRPVMMLAAGSFRVALATTHLPLSAVSAAITGPMLCETIEILDRDLRRWWRLDPPRLAVCGLNPHAGEGGHLGSEDGEVIAPAVARMRSRGLNVAGPFPADTIFVPRLMDQYDVVLAMYHDQGLPVIKHTHFDTAVNVTLGLPIVRTSVDHGTALELAGTGRAEVGSLKAALTMALDMIAAAS